MKKGLDVTTKGWSKEDLDSLRTKVNEQNYKWEAKCITEDNEFKWVHAYTRFDVETLALQYGYKILKVRQLRT